ncbi:hypothetical protein HUA74_30530 [Myxococcus sp. CA051A]|uniref:hypothetical protein n=1 Tax=unclassified Myxococcus TaxID=2648731 RepID=UPI00157A5E28|nr:MULTISPECIES: hypothetical protein [unclassified Myxococcus]NTX06407.1 hypothetical protein [Myxococcus sp. CA040A]NTX09662.1 hypothetical protein [Myxococcus sp. CA056]NTX35026.1 hypothetical protein [Myxococcus sp. CA033]NTX65000.1 hypothetical protein [Myxococcus sp. CA051A]
MNRQTWSGAFVVALLLTGCGGGAESQGPEAEAAVRQSLSGPWECDPAEWCHVSEHTLECPPGSAYGTAYAWPTQAGGYCTQRFACDSVIPLCPAPIDP